MSTAVTADKPTRFEKVSQAFQDVFAHLEQQNAARELQRRQLEALEQAQAERDRARLDQLANRLMLEYREAGEPPYGRLTRSMGVSKSTVSRLLNGSGKTLPRWWQVQALLKACGTADATIEEIKRMWIDIRNEQKPIFYDDEVILGD